MIVRLTAACLFVGGFAFVVAYATGILGELDPKFDNQRLTLVMLAVIFPATVEELVFRGPLLRWRKSWVIWLCLIAYVIWHPVLGIIRPEDATLFSNLWFLSITAVLGAAATWLTLTSNRIWPAIVLHWFIVSGWILLYGGPDFAR